MSNTNVILPSKPKVISEKGNTGVYEIENLYPGYGYTLGNALRRIILSSIPGVAITSVKIEGVEHEFSTMEGVKEDVITLLLNLKKLRFRISTSEAQKAYLKVHGQMDVTAGDIEVPGQIEIVDKKAPIATLTSKNSKLNIELVIESGIGYAPKEVIHREKMEIGSIALDATYTAVRRVNYEVENMRVGDRTDFNRLRLVVETDGILSAREVLETSISIMINQLRAIVGFQEEREPNLEGDEGSSDVMASNTFSDKMKAKVEELGLSTRTSNALIRSGVKTLGGLLRKSREDLFSFEGMGEKAVGEIEEMLVLKSLGLKK
ncbi:MAG: DNA-directed RNA polymerase subunit alpha [Parcubacteria group bacterium RIFCSPHIGHO2_01_FULL_45_26]|nr:MAG: DNA-directed RNA polymerase subunit alpha [Parcubacteria group bacterium RIFCSPHIGHO2_01_FULL_45_26]